MADQRTLKQIKNKQPEIVIRSLDRKDKWLFRNCDFIRRVIICEGISELPAEFFRGSTVESVTLPKTLLHIGNGAFQDTRELREIELPESLKSISANAFRGSSIGRIFIPEGVEEIPDRTFWDCADLAEIFLPKSLKRIGCKAFMNCHSLTDIDLPDSLIDIGHSAFWMSGIRSISVPKGVKKISDSTFFGCAYLAEVILSNSLKKIGNDAFSHCTALAYIDLPDSLNDIGCNAFWESGLVSIKIPPRITEIRSGVFYACAMLESVSLPKGLIKIGQGAFSDCGLTNLRLPGSLKYIGRGAFYGCSYLKTIKVPSRVKEIESSAFAEISNLETLTLPKKLTKITVLLSYQNNIREIELPPRAVFTDDVFSLSSIFDCNSLEKITASFYTISTAQFVEVRHRKHIKMKTFVGCPALRTAVIDGIETELHGDIGIDDFIHITVNCAAAGVERAIAKVSENTMYYMNTFIQNHDPAYAEKLLALANFTVEETNELIEFAIKEKSNEIYLMLLKYKQDRFGFEDAEERFKI